MSGVLQMLLGRGGAAVPSMPLDAFTANLVLAAGMHKLVSVATSSFQARNTGGGLLNIGFVGGVYDAAAVTAHGGGTTVTVPTLYDQIGGQNLTPVTAPAGPEIVTSGGVFWRGPRMVRGNTGTIPKTAVNIAAGAVGVTIFLKWAPGDITGTGFHEVFGIGTSSSNGIHFAQNTESAGNFTARVCVNGSNRAGKGYPAAGLLTVMHVTCMRVTFGSPAVVKLWKDNVEQTFSGGTINAGTATIASLVAAPLRLGHDFAAGNGQTFEMRDLAVYSAALSDADCSAISTALMALS